MCRVDHAGAANARPRRGLRPFRPCARFARSSDSAVGSLKCSPVSKRSSKSPVRAAAAASMGASVRPSAFGCGCCSDAARGGLRHVSILRICRSTGIALMVPIRARAGMPTARRPVCRAGLAHRAPSACKRPEPSSAAQALQCGAFLVLAGRLAPHVGSAAHVQQTPHVRCWRGTGCLLPQWEFSASAEIPACL